MGIDEPKLLLFILLLTNLIVIVGFRNWVLNNEAFMWLINGLPSWDVMEVIYFNGQNNASSGVKSLITFKVEGSMMKVG